MKIKDLLNSFSTVEVSKSHEVLIPEKFRIKEKTSGKYVEAICEDSNLAILSSNAMEFSATEVDAVLKYLGTSFEKEL